MKDKYRYMIFPDRTYVLTYEFGSVEITGEDILVMFRRGALLDTILDNLSTDEDYNSVLDIGEL
jgi:hypothetical protein